MDYTLFEKSFQANTPSESNNKKPKPTTFNRYKDNDGKYQILFLFQTFL